MQPQFINGNVRTNCPTCGGAVTTYEYRANNGQEYGTIIMEIAHEFGGQPYQLLGYKLLRCAGCGKGGMAEVHMRHGVRYDQGAMERFLPRTIDKLQLPAGVPDSPRKEFEEAELCASVQAWRGASALLRSALEKTLKENGYERGSLKDRIDEAAADGVITAARSRRAHENIRVLGNDVVHDEWREVTEEEFEQAHRYTQRILEDLYDDRPSVEAILRTKGRMT
jgi:hypothetical protein